ncbi:MAG TPA: type II toxin-antitoxin system VapC family toxin [Bryobacteraceae bacterium]|nr:type II toxin-antitoxin system VapC family toxin [Bryobacteraceae bacterium]
MSGFLLDTNVPSEMLRFRPDANVAAWLKSQVKSDLFLSVVTLGELRKGVMILPPGAKRSQIEQFMESFIPSWFSGRILPMTQAIAERWGILDAQRQLAGKPLGVADGMIAATALENDLTLVTRNVKDFAGLGVSVLNPWETA